MLQVKIKDLIGSENKRATQIKQSKPDTVKKTL